jgi:predicted TIM-barrel fold metal-dependent hydrolase
MPKISAEILHLVESTPFVDTHEHLLEESVRIQAARQEIDRPPLRDLGMLFFHYSDADLIAAGRDPKTRDTLQSPDVDPQDKWELIEPFYQRTRNTGYMQNVRETIRILYGEDDIRADNCRSLSEKIAALIRPGFYRHILKDVSRIEYCQVNSLEDLVFCETQNPDLLCQDISFVKLSTGLDVRGVAQLAQRDVNSLKDWHEVIDWCFATFGPRAIAVKNQSAYTRKLDYDLVPAEDVAPLFSKFLKAPQELTPAQHKAIQDHLFHYCVDKATEYELPVKLHTGYCSGVGEMLLHRVRHNAGDLCPILQAHPKARFVIMHIGYPYQDEPIALAKAYPNVYVDLCWAWIINPAASVRFVKEFLMAAPACKLLTFGGDYRTVEMVAGHARIARKGLAQALSELVSEGWVEKADVPGLVERLMRGNAHDLFSYDRALKNWVEAQPH